MQICLHNDTQHLKLSTSCSISSLKGLRPYMEDEYTVVKTKGLTVYAVFDGHGGREVATTLKNIFIPYLIDCVVNAKQSDRHIKQSITEAFINFDRQLYTDYGSIRHQGSTATVCLKMDFEREARLYVAHVGDSRVVAFSSDRSIIYQSRDHRPDNIEEYKRVRRKGGLIINSRVNGILAVTRAFGDFNEGIKLHQGKFIESKAAVTAHPDIAVISLKRLPFYIVIASDGLWDVFTGEDVINRCRISEDISILCDQLVNEAIHHRKSLDNVTAMVIRIDPS